jgi:alanyl-tRNA synthetase
MNQFKDIFLGSKSANFPRAVNSQKCLRVSGKHNDLEEVGVSNRHHTFFEMLGNWSFGDYYKQDAIKWAWELITDVWKLPKDRLYATVYIEDEEAEKFWLSETDIDKTHISRFEKQDNFWEMGEIGPCGPCSEIHYDLDAEGCDKKGIEHICRVNGECGRFIELWNLVFMQYFRDAEGKLSDLPAKNVDTGAGLERLSAVLQGGISNYDSDVFLPLIQAVESASGIACGKIFIPHRVIADHLRALTFALADGVTPSNDGRGYVLRRLLRRASRFGHEIGLKKPFLYKLTPIIVDQMGDIYPELKEKHQHISLTLKSEEESFSVTLERGLDLFRDMVEKLKQTGERTISGESAFKLYDTYGFPLDLTMLLARENGLVVDSEGFQENMSLQKERGRSSGKFALGEVDDQPWIIVSGEADDPSAQTFLGYDCDYLDSVILKYRLRGSFIEVIPKDTPFYAEAGGQVGDSGLIMSRNDMSFKVIDSYFDAGGFRILKVEGNFAEFQKAVSHNPAMTFKVDIPRRQAIKRNHTATHLLQYALRKVLGEHVHQTGSAVHPEYLRFDFTHHQKLTPEKIEAVERMVNLALMENAPVSAIATTLDDARQQGAMALFGEKYGENVRMIRVGSFSKELCGGTHCAFSGEIGHFRITVETGVSAGVRRIEAVTGVTALDLTQFEHSAIEAFREALHSHGSDVVDKLTKHILEKKDLEKEVERLRKSGGGGNLLDNAIVYDGVKIVSHKADVSNMEGLKNLADGLRDKLKSGIGFLGADFEGKASLVCVVTDDLIAKGIKAGHLAKKVSQFMGGNGGGRDHLATAGAKTSDKLVSALMEAIVLAKEALK